MFALNRADDEIPFSEASSGVPLRHSAGVAAWAVADLAFLLLIVFVLSVTAQAGQVLSSALDDTVSRGPETPSVDKLITVQVLFRRDPASRRETFEVRVESVPSLEAAFETAVEGRESLIAHLRGLRDRVTTLLQAHPEYSPRYILLSPPSMEYEAVFRTHAALQSAIRVEWFVGLHHPE